MGVKEDLYEEAKNNTLLMECWLFADKEQNPHKYDNADLTQSSTESNRSTPNFSDGNPNDVSPNSSFHGLRNTFGNSFEELNEPVQLGSTFGRFSLNGTSDSEVRSNSRNTCTQSLNSSNECCQVETEEPQKRKMSYAEANALVYKLDTPKRRFKPDYPFPIQGIVLRDSSSCHLPEEERQVFAYCGRVGKIKLDEDPNRHNNDYVWALAEGPNVYNGREFGPRPSNLISTKFVKDDGVEIRGYAVLGYGKTDASENTWIAWNDSIGSMKVLANSARLLKKKFTSYSPTLNVVKFIAFFEKNKFVIKKIDHITNEQERRDQFPENIFVVKNCKIREETNSEYSFKSTSFHSEIFVKQNQVDFPISQDAEYDIVVCPTFPSTTTVQYVGLCVLLEDDWGSTELLKYTKGRLNENTDRILGGNNHNEPDITTFVSDVTVEGTMLKRELILPPKAMP